MRASSKTNKVNCKVCNKEYMTLKNVYCSSTCRNIDNKRSKSESIEGEDGIDYVVCKWCGMKAKRLYLGHIKTHHPGKNTDDYKKDFPGAPLSCNKDNMKVAQGFVRYTQSEEGRKKSSVKIKGMNNPNSKFKADELTRKSRSPFSVEYYKKKGISEEDAKLIISELATNICKDRVTNTDLEFWVAKANGDEEEGLKLYKDRQNTFSLEKCISRHGEEKGYEVWKTRQDKWKIKVFNDLQWIGGGKSKISDHLFQSLKTETSMYGKNEKYIRKDSSTYKFDFCEKDNKKIIEFNGDFWHCNPDIYTHDYLHPVKKVIASEIWKHDKIKTEVANYFGYQVLTIWEKDYKDNPDQVIQKCIEFLNEKNIT
jgi:very-short-patch-repair endonuclease